MGGRGSGSSILNTQVGGLGVADRGSITWRGIVADFNPNAGHREVDELQSVLDFAAASKKANGGETEFLGVMDQGYFMKVAQGVNGACHYTDEMRNDMIGKDVTHYHNRYEATPQQIEETEEAINGWKTVARTYKRFQDATNRQKDADKEYNDTVRQIKRFGGDPDDKNPPARLKSLYDKKDSAWHEYELAGRQKSRAEQDFRDRFKSYTGKDAPSRTSDFVIPIMKKVTIDETGFLGGPFSAQDIDCNLVAKDIRSFSASCDEGVYTVKIGKECSDDDLMRAKARVRNLFRDPNQKNVSLTEEAKAFQKRIRGIDRRTAEEGRKSGWSKQQIRAASMNRQMAYLWETEKRILGESHISATFTPNKDFKPKWDY